MNEWEARVDKVLHSNVNSYIYGGVSANWGIGISAIQQNENCAPEQRWWLEVIQDVIYGIASGRNPRYQFCRNLKYDETLEAAYARYNLARNEATQSMIVGIVYLAGLNLADTLSVLDELAKPENYDKLPKSQAFVQAQGAAQARQRKIGEMTAGGSKNFSVRTSNSNSIRFDTKGFELQFSSRGGSRRAGKGFDAMSDGEIDALYQQWITEQRFKQMTPAQLKEIVRTGVQQNYVNRYKLDPHTNEPISRAADTEQLIDPRDGSPISDRKTLIRYINSAPNASRLLLCDARGKNILPRVRQFEILINSR